MIIKRLYWALLNHISRTFTQGGSCWSSFVPHFSQFSPTGHESIQTVYPDYAWKNKRELTGMKSFCGEENKESMGHFFGNILTTLWKTCQFAYFSSLFICYSVRWSPIPGWPKGKLNWTTPPEGGVVLLQNRINPQGDHQHVSVSALVELRFTPRLIYDWLPDEWRHQRLSLSLCAAACWLLPLLLIWNDCQRC